MDNITHTLTGVMMSRSGLNRWCPRATLILAMSANAPDADLLAAFGGALNYLDYHRWFTHSLLLIPVIALLPLGVMLLFARRSVLWKRAYALSVLGVASHVLLDWTNIYGVRLLSPLSDGWHRLDITSVVDLWIWAVLALASSWLLLARLVSSEIGARAGSGRAVAILALCFLSAYEFGRFLLHERAEAVLESRIYAGGAPRRVAAMPVFADPFRWIGLVETDQAHIVCDFNLRREFDPASGRLYYKPQPSEALRAAQRTPVFERFLRFSQYPVWRVVPTDDPEQGVRIEASDLRFGLPEEGRFKASAIFDRHLRLRRSWYQFDPPGAGPRFR